MGGDEISGGHRQHFVPLDRTGIIRETGGAGNFKLIQELPGIVLVAQAYMLSDVDADEGDPVFEFVVKEVEAGHISAAWLPQSSPEVQNHRSTIVGQPGESEIPSSQYILTWIQ